MKTKPNQGFIFNGQTIKTGLTFSDKLRIFAGCLILSALVISGFVILAELVIRLIW